MFTDSLSWNSNRKTVKQMTKKGHMHLQQLMTLSVELTPWHDAVCSGVAPTTSWFRGSNFWDFSYVRPSNHLSLLASGVSGHRNWTQQNLCGKSQFGRDIYMKPRVHKNKSMQRPISSLWGTGTAKFQVTWLLRIVQKGVSMWQCCAVDRWLMSGAYRCKT